MRSDPLRHAFTVDLEDWYQGLELAPDRWTGFQERLEVGTQTLLQLLADAGVTATFFVLGSAAERAPDLVRRIHAAGHEIGTHGYAHGFVYRLGPAGFAADLQRSLAILTDLLGVPVRGHRAPFFSVTRRSPWAFEVLRDYGLQYDSSVFPVRNYRYGIPDAPRRIHAPVPGMVEFPITTLRFLGTNLPVAGGAYFRLFPYHLTSFGLRRHERAGEPAVFYIHPWELDPAQPRLQLPRRIGITHYWNLRATAGRVRRLLRDFRFGPMGAVLRQHGWLKEDHG